MQVTRRPPPTPETFVQRLRRRASWFVRDRWPDRWVERDVSGVRMTMPWAHRLPDFARLDPTYGVNLVDLAVALASRGPIEVMDVGANIGDSTLLILDRAPARVLAVEPDEVYLPFLRHNVEGDDRVVIEASVLTTDGAGTFATERIGGTAVLREVSDGPALPTVSVSQLRQRHPDFDQLRLVKSDTDGYDVVLVPAIAEAWQDARPVLFFEYDHRASEAVGNDPMAVWDGLEKLGYTECAIWDNGGYPLARGTLAEARDLAAKDRPSSPAGFWDVAAVHASDQDGIAVIDTLMPRA